MDSELVVVCHCNMHQQLYYVENGELNTPLGPTVQYVDPKCIGNTWGKIPDNSKTYVYGVHCPVAFQIRSGLEKHGELVAIINEAGRVLKKGGKVIFGGDFDSTITDRLQAELNTSEKILHKWDFSIIDSKDFIFSLGHIQKLSKEPVVFPKMAIFTKPVVGGKRRQRRTYKNKGIRSIRPINHR